MKKYFGFIFCITFLNLIALCSFAQLKSKAFFESDELITMDLSSDFKHIVSKKQLNSFQPAKVTLRFHDSTVISEEIRLSARGKFRRENCYMPTLLLDFKNPLAPKLSSLERLKLVCGCSQSKDYEKLLLREFLVYKIYNLLSDMSFRVRLLYINYTDTRDKVKSYSQYGFLIEDTDKMASRNKCREVQNTAYLTQQTNRKQMTMVALFQYMIGNTDWAVRNYHNMKLMRPRKDSTGWPYPVPYDFDFCGVVNAHYASPAEELEIKSVRERVYRGFQRNLEEVEITLDIFRQKKEAIRELIMNFEPLSINERKSIMDYIDEFYKTIENKKSVESIFVTNARQT